MLPPQSVPLTRIPPDSMLKLPRHFEAASLCILFSSSAEVSKMDPDAEKEIRREKERGLCRYGKTGAYARCPIASIELTTL